VTPLNKEHLARLLGMLGSNAIGERANAASLANRMVRDAGLRWTEVLEGNSADRTAPNAQIKRFEAEIERLKAELAGAELRVFSLRSENSDILVRQHKLHREDIGRLESRLEEAHAMGRALTEQLQRERQTIHHERTAWAKERKALQLSPSQQRLLAAAEEREAKRQKRRERLAFITTNWGKMAALVFSLVALAAIVTGLQQQAIGPKPSHPQAGVDRVNQIVDDIVKNKH
jgi:hypothetical protein